MNSDHQITDMHLDVLKEIGNIGAVSCCNFVITIAQSEDRDARSKSDARLL